MVSALRGMIEESHTLTVEATVNQKRLVFGQFVDCNGLPLCHAVCVGLPLPLSSLEREYSLAELNGCNFEVKGRKLFSSNGVKAWDARCHCPLETQQMASFTPSSVAERHLDPHYYTLRSSSPSPSPLIFSSYVRALGLRW